MDAAIFAKTQAGHEEIHQRSRRLHPRLRSLLVVVDGKQTAPELLKVLAPAGVGPEHFEQLLELGLIEQISSSPQPVTQEAASPVVSQAVPDDPRERMIALYSLFGDTINTYFGLRGFSYQMALEKADSLEDYVDLGNEILRALEKIKGGEAASEFKSRVKPYFA